MLEWTQQILQIGKAFSGSDQTVLQDVLARQSGKFFDAFHDANLQVCMLQLSLVIPHTCLTSSTGTSLSSRASLSCFTLCTCVRSGTVLCTAHRVCSVAAAVPPMFTAAEHCLRSSCLVCYSRHAEGIWTLCLLQLILRPAEAEWRLAPVVTAGLTVPV